MLKKVSLLIALFLLLAPLYTYAKTYKVALIKTKDAFSYNETLKGYKKYIKKVKKYINRRRINLEVEEYKIVGEYEEDPSVLIEEIKKKDYTLVVTLGRRAFESVKDEIKETPIVFATMFNPYASGVAPDEKYQNITGIEMNIPVSVQLEALKSFVPYLQNIGVIYSETEENIQRIEEAEEIADDIGISIIPYKVNDERDVYNALDKLVKETDALWMIPDYSIYSEEILKHVVLTTIEHGFPFMGLSKAYVKAGALFTVGRDFEDIGKHAAMMSFDIIKNGVPEETKVQPLRKYPMVINKRTADSIDLRIPQWVSENTIEFYD